MMLANIADSERAIFNGWSAFAFGEFAPTPNREQFHRLLVAKATRRKPILL